MDEWHNCDGEIGLLLQKAVAPPSPFNDGEPTFFLPIARYARIEFLPVAYCPVCGEKLPPVKRQSRDQLKREMEEQA